MKHVHAAAALLFLCSCQSDGGGKAINALDFDWDDTDTEGSLSYYCGAEEIKTEGIRTYFRNVEKFVINGNGNYSEVRSLFSDIFTVYNNGRAFSYKTDELNITELMDIISIEDWMMMAEINEEGLSSVGYRGCIMSSGKVVFNTQLKTGRFGLAVFDTDREW